MSTPPTATARRDVIDEVLAIAPDSPLAALRAQRKAATHHIQRSYDELFEPEWLGGLTAGERYAIALQVVADHDQPELVAHYRARLAAAGPPGVPDTDATIESAQVNAEPHLAAALRHARLLTKEPASARPDDLELLRDAGVSLDGVVAVSQVVAFVSFQVRMVRGLSLIASGSDGAA